MEFDLLDLYQKRFGFVALPRQMNDLSVMVPEPFPVGPLPSGQITVDTYGLLGVPLMMPIKIDEVQLPNEPLISISGGKNIVSHEINGVDGTFKEEWTLRDYEITIRGIAVDDGDPDNLPENIIRQLRTLCEKKKSRTITSRITSIFNISLISIESWEFPDSMGAIGQQSYIIKGRSDREFELELKPTA